MVRKTKRSLKEYLFNLPVPVPETTVDILVVVVWSGPM
jgi:hypothetical protein